MDIKDQVFEDMKAALKAGEKEKLGALRMALAAIKNAEIDKREELSDDDVIQVLAKEVRKWEEAADEIERGGQAERAAKERRDAATLKEYLPEQLSEDELRELVKEAIDEAGAASPSDMGKVMQAVMPKVRGRADGKRVNDLVRQLLSQ